MSEQPSPIAGEFFGKLLESITIAHILHLQQGGPGSFARHMALGDLYDGLDDLTDSLIEEYQGCYDLVTDYKATYTTPGDALSFVDELYDYVQANRFDLSDESHIQNRIDEICSLISRTKYKLRFLE